MRGREVTQVVKTLVGAAFRAFGRARVVERVDGHEPLVTGGEAK